MQKPWPKKGDIELIFMVCPPIWTSVRSEVIGAASCTTGFPPTEVRRFHVISGFWREEMSLSLGEGWRVQKKTPLTLVGASTKNDGFQLNLHLFFCVCDSFIGYGTS